MAIYCSECGRELEIIHTDTAEDEWGRCLFDEAWVALCTRCIKYPNKRTIAAIKELEKGRGKSFSTIEELMDELEEEEDEKIQF